jgi:uncharacterized damage-inducible protein DinB
MISKENVAENPALATEIETFRLSAYLIDSAARVNLEGVTHEDSLVQPRPAGNCLNWVLGHLLTVHSRAIELMGGKPVIGEDSFKQYNRGSNPLEDSLEARDFGELKGLWQEAVKRLHEQLGTLTEERLAQGVPFSPRNDPNETVRSLLGIIMFHQSYHVGQLGVLRRIAGKDGAIR